MLITGRSHDIVQNIVQNMYRIFLHFFERTFWQWKVTISSKKKKKREKLEGSFFVHGMGFTSKPILV